MYRGYVQTTTSTPIVETPVAMPKVPVIPALPPSLPNVDPNPVVAQCGECGLMLRMVMGFVCPSYRCPVQPKVTC